MINFFKPGNSEIRKLRNEASKADFSAKFKIAEAYFAGNSGLTLSFNKAYKWYLRSVGDPIGTTTLSYPEKGHALYRLGYMTQIGLGTSADYKAACEYWRLAAHEGHSLAMYELGKAYEGGVGVIKDVDRAINYYANSSESDCAARFKKLFQNGHLRAAFHLGVLYQKGSLVSRDEAKAFEYFLASRSSEGFEILKKSADEGNKVAAYYTARSYEEGIGTGQAEHMACMYYQYAGNIQDAQSRLAALNRKREATELKILLERANKGDFYAQEQVADRYLTGKYTAAAGSHITLASEWYHKAADAGDLASAQVKLGNLYESGSSDSGVGLPKNLSLARKYFEKASSKLPNVLSKVEAVKSKIMNEYLSQKFEELQRLAKEGDDLAQNELGNRCFNGVRGASKDLAASFSWFEKSAKAGILNAIYHLALHYENGFGVEKDLKLALEGFQQVAQKNNADAQKKLADCYWNGIGVEKNGHTAFIWYQKAAKQGHAEAQYLLATLYEKGLQTNGWYGKPGATEDTSLEIHCVSDIKALEWYSKAALQQHVEALFKCGELCEKMNRSWEVQQHYRNAAERGHVLSLIKLGNSYEKSMQQSTHYPYQQVNTDWYQKATECYKKAALQGDVTAWRSWGRMVFLKINNLGVQAPFGATWGYPAGGAPMGYGGTSPVVSEITNIYAIWQQYSHLGEGLPLYFLGQMHQSGKYLEIDIEKAVDFYQKAAAKGCSEARVALNSEVCILGQGALAGNSGHQYKLANIYGFNYYNGTIQNPNYKRAKELYLSAANQGDLAAQYELGRLYEEGKPWIGKNLKNAFEWYLKLATSIKATFDKAILNKAIWNYSGYAEDALFRVGKSYIESISTEKDIHKGVEWLQLAVSGTFKSYEAHLYLAEIYEKGLGVDKDILEAYSHYSILDKEFGGKMYGQESQPQNSFRIGRHQTEFASSATTAMKRIAEILRQKNLHPFSGKDINYYQMGICYQNGIPERGEVMYLKKNIEKAIQCFVKGSDIESTVFSCCHILGDMYEQGILVTRSEEEAKKWYSKAMEYVEKTVFSRLMNVDYFKIGQYYENVVQNLEKAVQFYQQVRNVQAKKRLEIILPIIQFRAFQKDSERDDANAQYQLALCYENGTGTTKDLKLAYEWYLAAKDNGCRKSAVKVTQLKLTYKLICNAELGYGWAQFDLAMYYLKEMKDTALYQEWIRRAAAKNNSEALYHCGMDCLKGMTYEEPSSAPGSYTNRNKEAVQWFKKAEIGGHRGALLQLGLAFKEGLGAEKDLKRAEEYFKKYADQCLLAAKDMKNGEAAYDLGECYANKIGIEKDIVKACQWWQVARKLKFPLAEKPIKKLGKQLYNTILDAIENDPFAQYKIAKLYETGSSQFIEQDLEKAQYWYQKAASQGHIYSIDALENLKRAPNKEKRAEIVAAPAVTSQIGTQVIAAAIAPSQTPPMKTDPINLNAFEPKKMNATAQAQVLSGPTRSSLPPETSKIPAQVQKPIISPSILPEASKILPQVLSVPISSPPIPPEASKNPDVKDKEKEPQDTKKSAEIRQEKEIKTEQEVFLGDIAAKQNEELLSQQKKIMDKLSTLESISSEKKQQLEKYRAELETLKRGQQSGADGTVTALTGREKELIALIQREEEHQQAIQEQQEIQSNDKLCDYYYTFQVRFNDVLLACKTIHSEMVTNSKDTVADRAATIIQKIGQYIPVVGLVSEIFADALNFYSYREKQQAVNFAANFFPGPASCEEMGELLARTLTLYQKKDIEALATSSKAGFFRRQMKNLKALKDKILVNDIDTAIKDFSDKQCKLLLAAIMQNKCRPHPAPADLTTLIQFILPGYTAPAVVPNSPLKTLSPSHASQSGSASKSSNAGLASMPAPPGGPAVHVNAIPDKSVSDGEIIKKLGEQEAALKRQQKAQEALEKEAQRQRTHSEAVLQTTSMLSDRLSTAEQETKKLKDAINPVDTVSAIGSSALLLAGFGKSQVGEKSMAAVSETLTEHHVEITEMKKRQDVIEESLHLMRQKIDGQKKKSKKTQKTAASVNTQLYMTLITEERQRAEEDRAKELQRTAALAVQGPTAVLAFGDPKKKKFW